MIGLRELPLLGHLIKIYENATSHSSKLTKVICSIIGSLFFLTICLYLSSIYSNFIGNLINKLAYWIGYYCRLARVLASNNPGLASIIVIILLTLAAIWLYHRWSQLTMQHQMKVMLMFPLILMSFGMVCFGIGLAWSINNANRVSNELRELQVNIHDIPNKVEKLTNVTNAQMAIHFLQQAQQKFMSLKERYQTTGEGMSNLYPEKPVGSTSDEAERIEKLDNILKGITEDIRDIVKSTFNEDIDFETVDKRFDLVMPYPEEDQIGDQRFRYIYRRAQYLFRSNKRRMETLETRFRNELERNRRLIEKHARESVHSSQ